MRLNAFYRTHSKDIFSLGFISMSLDICSPRNYVTCTSIIAGNVLMEKKKRHQGCPLSVIHDTGLAFYRASEISSIGKGLKTIKELLTK